MPKDNGSGDGVKRQVVYERTKVVKVPVKAKSKKVSLSVPNMSGQAKAIVGSQVGSQKLANKRASNAAINNYKAMLAELDAQLNTGKGAINSQATVDRAQLNNQMAARGISVGDSSAMNFARFNDNVQGKVNELADAFQRAAATAAATRDERVNAMSEANRMLDANAPGQAFAIQQQLEASALDRQMKAAQLAAMNDSAAANEVGSDGLTAYQRTMLEWEKSKYGDSKLANDQAIQFTKLNGIYDALGKYDNKTTYPSQFVSQMKALYGVDVTTMPDIMAKLYPAKYGAAQNSAGSMFGFSPQQIGARLAGGFGMNLGGIVGQPVLGAALGTATTSTGRKNIVDLWNKTRSGITNLFR